MSRLNSETSQQTTGHSDNEPTKDTPQSTTPCPVTISASNPLFNKSVSYSLSTVSCDATVASVPTTPGAITRDAPPGSSFLPTLATTGEMKLPDDPKSVPMVMLSVPDGRTVMAIPVSSLGASSLNLDPLGKNNSSGQLINIQINTPVPSSSVIGKNVQPNVTGISSTTQVPNRTKSTKLDDDCKKLLTWKNGVGVLDGCDGIKFRIDDFGKLQAIDSDDEDENEDMDSSAGTTSEVSNVQRRHPNVFSNGICATGDRLGKKARHIRKFSHGSSLLSGGPDDRARRMKSASAASAIAAARLSVARAHNLCNTSHSRLSGQSKPIPLNIRESNRETNDPEMNWTKFIEKLMPIEQLNAIKTDEICKWRPDDVQKFVDSITGCSGNGQLFKDQEICGRSLLLLNQSDLVSVLGIKLGPAVKIFNAILMVREHLRNSPKEA